MDCSASGEMAEMWASGRCLSAVERAYVAV